VPLGTEGAPGRVPLGTDGDPGGRVPLGTDEGGTGGTAGLTPLVAGGIPGRVPLGTDGAPGEAAAATDGALGTAASPVAGVVTFASGTKTSTEKLNERCSPGSSAPTLTTCRATSSPFSFLMETRTEYSHA